MKRKGLSTKAGDVVIYAILTIITLLTFYIFWYCAVGAFSTGDDFASGKNWFWPAHITLDNFKSVLADTEIYGAFVVSILRTVIGTITSVLFTVTIAYGMSKSELRFNKFYSIFMLITMYFAGGLIPNFILFDNLGLMDSFWVYIIPNLFSLYNMIILRNAVSEIPKTVIEAAKVDGCGEYRTLWSIVIPMSKGSIMAIVLFNAVGHWNSYYDTLMFTSNPNLQTAQYYLYNMIVKADQVSQMLSQGILANPDLVVNVSSQSVRMAAVLIISLPILVFYPFVQKHFVKGAMVGSVKE